VQRKGHGIIQQTTEFWSRRTGEEISPEDAREAVVNVVGFFQLLNQWDQYATGNNDTGATRYAVGAGHRQIKTAN